MTIRKLPLGRLAATAAAVVAALATGATEGIASQVGSHYYQTAQVSCADVVCALKFTAIPANRIVEVTRVSCKILTSVSSGTPPPLVIVETGSVVPPNLNPSYSRGAYLAPFDVVYFVGTGRTYSLNAETSSIVLAGERPAIVATLAGDGAHPGIQLILQCHLSGAITSAPA